MNIAPDILIVIATLVCGFSVAGMLSAWSDRVFPKIWLAAFAAGIGSFVFGYLQTADPNGWHAIPNAFISVLARVVN